MSRIRDAVCIRPSPLLLGASASERPVWDSDRPTTPLYPPSTAVYLSDWSTNLCNRRFRNGVGAAVRRASHNVIRALRSACTSRQSHVAFSFHAPGHVAVFCHTLRATECGRPRAQQSCSDAASDTPTDAYAAAAAAAVVRHPAYSSVYDHVVRSQVPVSVCVCACVVSPCVCGRHTKHVKDDAFTVSDD
jgi:hypothetical protein